MTNLSVNVNKFATLRNARGGNMPDVVQAVKDCERFGAQASPSIPDLMSVTYATGMYGKSNPLSLPSSILKEIPFRPL